MAQAHRVSHRVIESCYRVLLWYDGNRGAGRAGIVRSYYDAWRSLHALTVNVPDEAWRSIRGIARSIGVNLSSREQDWMFLFAVETYLHLFVRALALSKLGRAPRDLPSLIGSVSTMRQVFAPSVFEWIYDAYSDGALPQQLRSGLQASVDLMLSVLYNLNTIALTADAFRELYQNLIPAPLRRSLGEFYTREDIVDEVLDAAGLDCNAIAGLYDRWRRGDKPVILDPACGSGTFLVRVIRRIFRCLCSGPQPPPQDVASFVEDVVVGVDVNPFAVEMAKLNVMLATAEEMRRCGGYYVPQRVRVYWADSLAVVRANTNVLGASSVLVEIPMLAQALGRGRGVPVPALPGIGFDELVHAVHEAVRTGKRLDDLRGELEAKVGREAVEAAWGELGELYRALSEIERAGNSRLVEFIKNAGVVASLIGRCDYVVGNPPWVRIHRVARHVIELLRSSYSYYREGSTYNPRFKRTRIPFREQHDYSLAFVERGLQFLREGGVLGYVITSKVLKTTYAGRMREDLLTDHTVLELRDYSLYPRPLFQDAINYPLIMAVRREKPSPNHLVRITVANTTGQKRSFAVPQAELPLDLRDTKSPWLTAPPNVIQVFRKIVRASVRLGDVYEVYMGVKTAANELFVVDKIIRCDGGIAEVRMLGGEVANVEADLLHLFVRGRDIDPFQYKPEKFIIFPHDCFTFGPLWDDDQRRILQALGLLRQGVDVAAAGGALVYELPSNPRNPPCTTISQWIATLKGMGFAVSAVTPCAVTACYEVLKGGQKLLTLRIERSPQHTCRVYVEGLRIPGRPEATRYFMTVLDMLVGRDDYRATLPPWAVFRVSQDKFKNYRIAWQDIARHLEACFLPVKVRAKICGTDRDLLLIPDTTVYFIVEENCLKALKLLLYLNSDLARNLLKLVSWVRSGGHFAHKAVCVAHLPIPIDLLRCHVWDIPLRAILQKEGQEESDLNRIAEEVYNHYAEELTEELIRAIGIERGEYDALIEYGRWLNEQGGPSVEEGEPVEEEENEE